MSTLNPEVLASNSIDSNVESSEIVSQKMAEGRIEGQVACIDGPVWRATVSLGVMRTVSDSKGNFVFDHAPPGIGKIRVKSPETKFQDIELDILITAGECKKDVFIFLAAVTGTIEGIVTDENNKPIVGAVISGIYSPSKPPEVLTDQTGHFSFAEVPSGSYYVRAVARGHMVEGISVVVKGGEKVQANFIVKSGNLSVSGHVLTQKDHLPADCQIYLRRNGLVVTSVKTTASGDGKYSFENLVPDVYDIGIVSAGYAPKGWSGKVETSETVDFELEVPPKQDSPHCADPNFS